MAHRIFGLTTHRTHHLLSNLELGCFLLLDRSDAVTDIREQYPLHPLDETLDIADQLGYRHPAPRRTRKGISTEDPIVMTTDLFVSLGEGVGAPELAIAVKPSDELRRPLVLRKLEIERQYWARREIPWRIVTERELPVALIDNLQFLRPFHSLEDYGLPSDETPELLSSLLEIITGTEQVLNAACKGADQQLRLPTGGALTLVWHALATQAWRVDLCTALNPDERLVIQATRIRWE